jgi:uncharacterized protein YjbI with pentapeptide repeats
MPSDRQKDVFIVSRIQIFHRTDKKVLYEGEHESLRDAVVAACLIGADLQCANLADAYLEYANLANGKLAYACFEGASLEWACLAGADLRYADFGDAELANANLTDADLAMAFFSGANLEDADLSDADLAGACLVDANFIGANLTGVCLFGADLCYEDLDGANISDKDLDDGTNIADDGVNLAGNETAPAPVRESLTHDQWKAQRPKNRHEAMLRYRTRYPEVPVVEDLDTKVLQAINAPRQALDMSRWHSCDTMHCRAGWAIHLAGNEGYVLEDALDSQRAGRLIYMVSTGRSPHFFVSDEQARVDIERCAAESRFENVVEG